MIDKLEGLKIRFEEVGDLLVLPDTVSDMKRYSKLNKEYKDLKTIVDKFEEYKNVLANIASSKEMLSNEKDPEFREMAKAELDEIEPEGLKLEEQLKVLLIPKDSVT